MIRIFLLLLTLPFLTIAQNTKKVLLIGIDGCRPDALLAANTPTLDGLINNGIFSPHALNNDITISGPGWSAILCGVWSNKHLVTGNDFEENNYYNYPPLFERIEAYNEELHTASICNWDPINDYIVQDYSDYKLNVSSDADVSLEACDYLANNDPDLLFLHFDDVDHAGHAEGFSPDIPEYIAAIEGVDAYITPILTSITQRPNYATEDWLFLVTTDHGGINTSHGGSSIEEETVFVIASGDNIPTTLIKRDSSLVVESIENCLGDFPELQFDGSDFIKIAHNSNYDFGDSHDFTVECRVRTNTAADVAIVGNKDWDSGNNKGFVFSFSYPSGPEWKVNIGDGTNRVDINTGGSIADNEWHTLSVSFDRNGWMKMYEDGNLLDSADITSIGDITTTNDLFFGTDINQAYGYIGSMAEARLWNSVITPTAIENWHCTTLDDSHPDYNNLVGYWKLQEGVGETAADLLGNSGTIEGANWNDSDTSWMYDYTSTPRITDVPVTALIHLCIPLDINWQLDGMSLISDCTSTITDEIDSEQKGLIKIIDVLGRTAVATNNSPLFYLFNDGSVEKKMTIE
jgi:hypothetical protein